MLLRFFKKLAQNNFARKALVGGKFNIFTKLCSIKVFYCLRNKK